jgi:hypothetical protein
MWLVPHMSVENSSEMPRLIREVPRRPVHRIDTVDQCVHRPKVICHDRQEHRSRGEAHDVETVVHDVEDSRDSLQRERWDVCQDGAVLLCHDTGKPDGGSVVQSRGDPVVSIVAGVGGAHVEGLREWPLDDVAEGTRVGEDVRVWQRSWWRRFVTHDRGFADDQKHLEELAGVGGVEGGGSGCVPVGFRDPIERVEGSHGSCCCRAVLARDLWAAGVH